MTLRARLATALLLCGVVGAASCDASDIAAPTLRRADLHVLQLLVDSARSGGFGDVRSLVLAVEDDEPVEFYFRGARRDDLAPIYSISKSITSLLAGAALLDGALDSVRAPLDEVLPAFTTLLHADERRAQMTVEDLLTMRSGIAWNEHAVPYGTPGNPVTTLFDSPDWITHMLTRDMAIDPGTTYSYNTGATVVLGAAIAQATGRPLADFARDALFAPLGISQVTWHQGPLGVANAGSGLSMRAVDLLAIGRMVLAGGTANGTTLVSADWIAESFTPRAISPLGTRYGYQWWLLGPDGPWDPDRPVLAAIGWGGQLLLLLPDRQLVAVISARNFDFDALVSAQRWARRLSALVPQAMHPTPAG